MLKSKPRTITKKSWSSVEEIKPRLCNLMHYSMLMHYSEAKKYTDIDLLHMISHWRYGGQIYICIYLKIIYNFDKI